jgi:transcriptional regulator with XRE-family HTH domain
MTSSRLEHFKNTQIDSTIETPGQWEKSLAMGFKTHYGSPMVETLSARLERAMRDAGYNPRSLSLAAELGMTAVRDILDERVASPRYATLSSLAKVLGVSAEYLATGEQTENPAPVSAAAAVRDFPIYAAARGGDEGALVMDSSPIQYIARPDPLLTVMAAFGVYVVGESMSPAYEQGDIALVHPGLPPRRGADVILTRPDAHGTPDALIKHLVGWDEIAWKLRQYNPPRDFTLPRAEWTVKTIVGRYNAR